MPKVKVEYDVDTANQRLVITTTIGREACATYITFEDMSHPLIVGAFFTKWGNKWLNKITRS